MGEGRLTIGFWWRNLRESDHLRDLSIHGNKLLKRFFEKVDDRIDLAQDSQK
jgi:hypothetical protein